MNGHITTLTLCFIILFSGVVGCISKNTNKAEDSDFTEMINSQKQTVSDLKQNQRKMSTRLDESPGLEVEFTFDLERTAENPLRGFYTNYAWSEPITDFPDSLEFASIPLLDLIVGAC